MAGWRTGMLIVALVMAACGSDGSDVAADGSDVAADGSPVDDGSTVASTNGIDADDIALFCGAALFPSLQLEVADLTPLTDDIDAYVPDEARVEWDLNSERFATADWYEVDRTNDEFVAFAVWPESLRGEAPYFDATFRRVAGRWRVVGWGDCWIKARVEDWGIAELALDPTDEPTAGATEITLLATERACANGEAPTGRGVESVVVESAVSVQIFVFVEPLRGDATCPGNPSFPHTVSLSTPLGDRTLLDASIQPARELVWPIPLPPSELSIVVAGSPPTDGTAHAFSWTGGDHAGGLLLSPSGWFEFAPGWVQGLPGDEATTITGFVAECGDEVCVEECAGPTGVDDGLPRCADIPAVGATCTYEHPPTTERHTTVTLDYAAAGCTIEVATRPVTHGA